MQYNSRLTYSPSELGLSSKEEMGMETDLMSNSFFDDRLSRFSSTITIENGIIPWGLDAGKVFSFFQSAPHIFFVSNLGEWKVWVRCAITFVCELNFQ